MDPRFSAESAGAVLVDCSGYAVFGGILAVLGLYGLVCGVRSYGPSALLPWNVPSLTRGIEEEALRVYLSDPTADLTIEARYAAGQAALRRLRGRV